MFRPKKGRLEVIAGCMFSGKSTELIKRVERAQIGNKKVQAFKPILDNRYHASKVTAHNGSNCESIPVENSQDLLSRVLSETQLVAIDEGQFFDEGLTEVVVQLIDQGVRVIVAGLDTDFKGEPFGPMPFLLAEADMVDKQYAVCMICGEDANRTQRIVNGVPANYDDPIIMVGAAESYEARCRNCHDVPGRPY